MINTPDQLAKGVEGGRDFRYCNLDLLLSERKVDGTIVALFLSQISPDYSPLLCERGPLRAAGRRCATALALEAIRIHALASPSSPFSYVIVLLYRAPCLCVRQKGKGHGSNMPIVPERGVERKLKRIRKGGRDPVIIIHFTSRTKAHASCAVSLASMSTAQEE